MWIDIGPRRVWLALDVKNYIGLLGELGADASDLRRRYDRLAAELPDDDRRNSPDWARLETDVLALDEALPADGPYELADIQAARPDDRVDRYDAALDEARLDDRIAGAWAGRIAGCILGKPVETFMKKEGSRANLKRCLSAAGEYPIADYVSQAGMAGWWGELDDEGLIAPFFEDCPKEHCLREQITYAPTDDDIRYSVVSLMLLERYGTDFDRERTLEFRRRLLHRAVSPTGRDAVVRNRVLGMGYPEAARFMNVSREYLSSQIRVDPFGYACPGDPERAARLAWRDAAATSSENGVYGAMWIAACIAAAFVEPQPEAVLRRGLEQIPADCRLARHVRSTIDAAGANGEDYEATFDDIERRTGQYHVIHAVSNGCLIAAGLIHGCGDFSRTICTTVMGGCDTDCNGAHAGSIAGAMLGRSGIPDRWVEPFHDTVRINLPDTPPLRISDLAGRTGEVVRRQRNAEQGA
jgi:ADP-ribosylglycohydrolase